MGERGAVVSGETIDEGGKYGVDASDGVLTGKVPLAIAARGSSLLVDILPLSNSSRDEF
jgi:hypothetical protein